MIIQLQFNIHCAKDLKHVMEQNMNRSIFSWKDEQAFIIIYFSQSSTIKHTIITKFLWLK